MGIPSLATFAKTEKKILWDGGRKDNSVSKNSWCRNELKVMTEKREPDVNRDYITSIHMSPHNRDIFQSFQSNVISNSPFLFCPGTKMANPGE